MKATPKIWLNSEEIAVLEKIAKRSKMDIWFEIRNYFDSNGELYTSIYDCERKYKITLYNGVKWLQEGMSYYEEYSLSKGEIATFEGILDKLNLPHLITHLTNK